MWERLEPWLLLGLIGNEIRPLNVVCESIFCASHCVCFFRTGNDFLCSDFYQMVDNEFTCTSSFIFMFFDKRKERGFPFQLQFKKFCGQILINIAWIWNPHNRMEIFQWEKVDEVEVTKISLPCCIFQGSRVGGNLFYVFCCCFFGGLGDGFIFYLFTCFSFIELYLIQNIV